MVNDLSGWVNWSKLALPFLLSSSSSSSSCLLYVVASTSSITVVLKIARVLANSEFSSDESRATLQYAYLDRNWPSPMCLSQVSTAQSRQRSCWVQLCWLILEFWVRLGLAQSFSFGCNSVQLFQFKLDLTDMTQLKAHRAAPWVIVFKRWL